MLGRSRALEDRLRARQGPLPSEGVERQIPRTALVPLSAFPPASLLTIAFLEARRIVSDPLESQISSILLTQAMENEASWYQTKAASKVASDLQQSSALNVIFQSVEISDPRRDDKNKEWERNLSEVLTQGKTLVNRLQRYEADFWNPDLRDLAGRVLRVIHPDGRDPRLLKRFNPEALRDMYRRALAARGNQRSASLGLFVRDAERVLFWQIRTLLSEGLSLEQIGTRYPTIGPDLMDVRWQRFVRAKQQEIAEQVVSGRKRREEHSQGHVESFGVIVGAIDAIATYGRLEEYPCRNQLVGLQTHLHQVEALSDQLPDIEHYPMAKFKADQLQGAIEDLVRPVTYLANIIEPGTAGGAGMNRKAMLNGAIASLGSLLEYTDSAARSYLEWLEERIAARRPQARRSVPPLSW